MTESSDPTVPPVDGLEAFKGAFRRHAAGVAVITTRMPDGRPAGYTATSLASLSAVPPMATFSLAHNSSTYPAITVGNYVVIHTLGPRSQHQAERMAADYESRFVGEHWHVGPHNVPVLDDVTAWMVAKIVEVHPVHNSSIVVVEIEGGSVGDDDDALLYHQRQYFKPGTLET